MTNDVEFRSPEEEVVKLLEECGEIRNILKGLSAQLTRIETRLKRAFPSVNTRFSVKRSTAPSASATITPEQTLAEFDKVVDLVKSRFFKEAERLLTGRSSLDLLVISKELGITFPKSKPSMKSMREAIFGKVRESVQLSSHSRRA
ncbi:MAG: hypothetical protein ACXW3X_02870 [Rhodoplanes sp.]